MESAISMKNVNLWYEKGKPIEIHALKNITLDIRKGDYVSFFGPSGCGKTTMLYAIAGIDRFQEGQVNVNGNDMSQLSNRDLAIFRQSGIGIIFQQFNLIPSLTVIQNVALPMSFLGTSAKEADEKARILLERLALTPYANRYPFELSGGQQQRVGIARALANDPPIIIADEPLGNLDSVNAQKVLEFLKELNEKDGRTIIMVTHEAWSLRDVKTIFYMKDGEITGTEQTGTKDIAESLTKHLYSQLSTTNKGEVSEATLSARVLAHFLLRGYSLDEMTLFEKILEDRLSGKLDEKAFLDVLIHPNEKGGLGLWKQKAKRVEAYVEKVIELKLKLKEVVHILETQPEASIMDDVYRIRDRILYDETDPVRLSHDQIKALDQAISDRIRGFINMKEFVDVLKRKESRFGVGLSTHRAIQFGEKMEVFLDSD